MIYLGACGYKCSLCPRFIATADNDTELLNSILELYIKIGHRPAGTKAESLKCNGCKTSPNCAYPELRDCVASKKLENCGQCASYPCEKIEQVFVKTGEFKDKIDSKAGGKMMRMFKDSFLRKKEYLDDAHKLSK